MQLIDVKRNDWKNVMILQENFACAISILFISFYMILGTGHLPAHSVPSPGNFSIFIKKKNTHARGRDGNWLNWLMQKQERQTYLQPPYFLQFTAKSSKTDIFPGFNSHHTKNLANVSLDTLRTCVQM